MLRRISQAPSSFIRRNTSAKYLGLQMAQSNFNSPKGIVKATLSSPKIVQIFEDCSMNSQARGP